MLLTRLATAECSEGTEYQTVWAALLLLCQQKYQVTTPDIFKVEVKSGKKTTISKAVCLRGNY